ncbi:hypothetical protein PB2503_04117 [Parvularcula bermudensis HTCC2503]|uniref:Uncharacterized protein n=1 Tax=Parvularcula bermudensis (strain ATCC BAA-594 / HTCC2503 / KCTC 12087) TaxID=314260 RepID=E0TEL5_PARBH|nr:hypothetical protein [Parvularcula bermudensis]ADM08898.1 hypothetical protein PB2503_04117 [Parvularcula bermudensis HTCC2503]
MSLDDEMAIDPAVFSMLEQDAPVLARLRQFALGLDRINWFAHLGEPPSRAVREAAAHYADRLGFPEADLAILADFDDAAAAAETLDWSSPAWEAEELLRADLTARALTVVSEEALEVGLKLIAQYAATAAKERVEEQAALWDMADEAAVNLAVGSLVQAINGAALALVAAADGGEPTEDHPFICKLRLFERGRWPVALIGSSLSVF